MTKRATDVDTEVLEVAVELHAEDEAARDAERARQAVHEAAVDLGVDGQLERAAAEVERRRLAAVASRARRKRWTAWIGGGVFALALGVGAWQLATPSPPTPWTLIADRASWILDVSPGTRAHQRFETDAGQPVAVVEVERAQPGPAGASDGTWFVNLDLANAPALAGHDTLAIELAGTLPRARVYLEAGSDERWRSPPIAVQPNWTIHRLPLATFEHQKRQNGKWHVVETREPTGVQVISVKLGHFVNEPEATGFVRIRGVHAE
jgi:hypothetical protein